MRKWQLESEFRHVTCHGRYFLKIEQKAQPLGGFWLFLGQIYH